MSQTLYHRGPDSEGTHVDGHVGIAARRLAIIDLTGGDQPITNEDGTVTVVQNGEIYNYRELMHELEQAGHRFRTRCDTEVLVHGYEEWGDALPERLRGMFAFAVWDAKKRRLLMARDRLGIKPLYYNLGGVRLSFGSELKQLLRDREVPRELDEGALDCYLSLRYVPAGQTALQKICKLPPAHLAVFENGQLSLKRYWKNEWRDGPEKTDAELQHELWDTLRARV